METLVLFEALTRNSYYLGRIINIAFVVGLVGNVGQANYSGAKAGVIGFTETVAKEQMLLFLVLLRLTRLLSLGPITKKRHWMPFPWRRYGQPEEVAGLVEFLALDPAAGYITGQVLAIDGGMVM
ncbi:hypothetical protein OROHE_005234 [Orobanche hederae]